MTEAKRPYRAEVVGNVADVPTMHYAKLLGLALISFAAAQCAQGATFTCMRQVKDYSPSAITAFQHAFGKAPPTAACTLILLTGPIVSGDTKRLKKAFIASQGFVDEVNLNSSGGNLREAMGLGRLLRKTLLGANAPYQLSVSERFLPPARATNPCRKMDCVCASACFVAWAGGARRTGDVLAVHRPRFDPAYFSGLTLAAAQREYQRSLDELRAYFAEVDIPPAYYDRMLNTRSAGISFLTKEEASSLFSDYAPAVDEWLSSKCGVLSKDEGQAFYDYNSGGEKRLTEQEYERLKKRWGDIEICRVIALIQERRSIYKELSQQQQTVPGSSAALTERTGGLASRAPTAARTSTPTR